MSHLTRTQQRSQPRAGTRLPRTRQARQRGRQSAPWCWTRTRRPRRRSPRGRGTASTSWGCTPKRDRHPLHRPPGAPPATPTCSAPSWGPPRLLQRPPQATSSVARTPCSSQARPLPQARGARPTTAPAPRLPVRVLRRGASGGGGCLREWRPEARAAPPWRAGPRVHLSPWPRAPASHLRPPLRCLHRRPVRRAPADLRPGRPGPAPARPLLRISPRGPSRPARTLPLRPQRPAPGLQRRLPAAG